MKHRLSSIRGGRFATLLVAAALAIVAVFGGWVPARATPPIRVEVTGGVVTGAATDGMVRFLGIPFAASTGGSNRFRPPQPVPPWAGARDATRHGAQCPQNPAVPVPTPVANDENCLTVDLYVPARAHTRPLPVMVFYYGGDYLYGANYQYEPTRLVTDGDVIVAVPNYRVGPFGFLALPELAASDNGRTGNYGLQDQIAALRWIRANATAFGGDPGNVTIFGESAGGASVCDLLAAPAASGLFQKAISESGGCASAWLAPAGRADAYRRSAAFAASVGCARPADRLSCLRALPAARLLAPAGRFDGANSGWVPTIDGVDLPEPPDTALAHGRARGIPIIVGSNAEEGVLFVALSDLARGRIPSAADYGSWVRDTFGPTASAVLARYPVQRYPSPIQAKIAVITDAMFACPALATTAAARRGGSVVWQYEVTRGPFGDVAGAFHGADVVFLFHVVEGIPLPHIGDDRLMARQMQQRWTDFARTGRPDAPGLPAWRPWNPGAPTAFPLQASTPAPARSFADTHDCAFWLAPDHAP